MPGPKSKPWARDSNGRIVQGKSALRHAHLRSGQNRKISPYGDPDHPVLKWAEEKKSKRDDS